MTPTPPAPRPAGGITTAAVDSAPEVVIDTNVVLDSWLFADPAAQRLAQDVASGRLRWVCTPAMADELAAVLARPLAPRWEAARERLACLDLSSWRNMVDTPPAAPPAPGLASRDPDDQKFIDVAVARRCVALFSRDRALLDLHRAAAGHGVVVLRPCDYQAAGSFLRSSNSLSGRCTT